GGGARAGPAGPGLASAALPDAHLETRAAPDADEFGVDAAREERVGGETRTELGQGEAGYLVQEHHAVRGSHPDAGDLVGAPGDLERALDDLTVGVDRDLPPVPHRLPHVDGHAAYPPAVQLDADRLDAGVGLDPQRVGAHEVAVTYELGEAADAVAAHLGAAAVVVVDDHPAVGLPVRRPLEQDEAVRADAASPVAQSLRERCRIAREARARVDVDEVVRRAVQLR